MEVAALITVVILLALALVCLLSIWRRHALSGLDAVDLGVQRRVCDVHPFHLHG
jgi:hypothetical protein